MLISQHSAYALCAVFLCVSPEEGVQHPAVHLHGLRSVQQLEVVGLLLGIRVIAGVTQYAPASF